MQTEKHADMIFISSSANAAGFTEMNEMSVGAAEIQVIRRRLNVSAPSSFDAHMLTFSLTVSSVSLKCLD
jgi:hypothetical protein